MDKSEREMIEFTFMGKIKGLKGEKEGEREIKCDTNSC